MPRVSERQQIKNEHLSTIENTTLASIIYIDSESKEDENSYFDTLNNLAIAHTAIESSRYFNRRFSGSAGKFSIDELINEFLNYPSNGFVAQFRCESFWNPADLLYKKGLTSLS
jgi:hypothetical protein